MAASTVSRAFSRPGRVNAETAERVRAAANELGYRANPQARALSTTRTMILAVVLADVTNPGFFDVVRGAGAAATDAGYTVMLAESQESAGRERDVLERAASGVDGIVLAGSRMSDGAIRKVSAMTPVVLVNRDVPGVPSVVADIGGGARLSLEHLHRLGHTDVTYLAGPEASWPDGMRWRSLRLTGSDLGVKVRRLGPFSPTLRGGVQAVATWRESERRSTAVIAYNDLIAIGFIRAIVADGGSVPGDVSVLGSDNTSSADLITPSLTSVASPMYDVGTVAARNVLAMTAGAVSSRSDPVRVPTRLVVRESTAAPGGGP